MIDFGRFSPCREREIVRVAEVSVPPGPAPLALPETIKARIRIRPSHQHPLCYARHRRQKRLVVSERVYSYPVDPADIPYVGV